MRGAGKHGIIRLFTRGGSGSGKEDDMMMKRMFALLLAALLLATSAALAEEPAQDVVMATVNGREIMASAVVSIYENVISYYTRQGYDMTTEENMQAARWIALRSAVQEEVIAQKAVELGLDQVSDEDMARLTAENDQMWEDAIQAYVDAHAGENATEEDINAARTEAIAYYESAGYTMDGTLQESVTAFISERVQAALVEEAVVTDEDIAALFNSYVEDDKSYYEGNVFMYEYMTNYYGQQSYYMPTGYRGVTHILLKVDEDLLHTYDELADAYAAQQEGTAAEGTEGTEGAENTEATSTDVAPVITAEEVAAAKAAVIASVQPTIDEIMAKFNAGTPFAELIAEYGTDPGMQSEPYKSEGYAVHADSIVWDPAFIEAAMSIPEVGGVSEPAVGSYGVHIVYYLRDIPGGAVELTEEMQNELRETLMAEKENELFNAAMAQLMGESEIVYTEYADDWREPDETEEAAEETVEETTETIEAVEETVEETTEQAVEEAAEEVTEAAEETLETVEESLEEAPAETEEEPVQ